MDEEPPMSLVEDHFDDMTVDDQPLDDGSFYNEDDLQEEDAQPTSENFSAGNRYKPSHHHTPGQLPTIREEKQDESHSNNGSRATSRPPSVNLKQQLNMSESSHDFSGQFQNGANAIEQYTENFYAKHNDAERLFPEHQLLAPTFASPTEKQNSWEPSVCHYEKQPAPEVITDSPKLIFGNLSRGQSQTEKKVNDENEPVSSKFSPERSVYTTSPLSSTRFLETKTSTPKRPGASNRLGQRHPPALELSTIYDMSPQRANGEKRDPNRLFPLRASTTNTNSPSLATSSQMASDTMMSNRTISESMVRNVLNAADRDTDLIAALDMARKRRERAPSKPDFRVKPVQNRTQSASATSTVLPAAPSSTTSAPASSRTSSSNSTRHHHQKPATVSGASGASSRSGMGSGMDVSNSNTINNTTNLTRMANSTAKSITASRENLSRMSRGNSTYSSASQNTVIPAHHPTGRDSVNSMRTISRASTSVSTAVPPIRPLKITARRMAFGVVNISDTMTRDLELENVSDRLCQVHTSIDSKTSVYQILDSKMTLIEPGKTTRLRVSFTPTSIGRYQVLLIVEVPAQNFQQKIPIWGVGGAATISPVISAQDLLATANPSEFAMYTSNLSRVSFKLANTGQREGFALLKTYDSFMRPLPAYSVTCFPSSGLILRRNHEKRVDIRIDTSGLNEESEDRTSSAMSSVSTTRRRVASGADLVVQIAWGNEVLRQRLKMLESQTGRHQDVDGHDFTSARFTDEDPSRAVPKGFPNVVSEDFSLFASSYRSIFIFVYSSHAAFRRAASLRTSSDSAESTVLETTAFRSETFVNEATMLSKTMRR